MAGRVFDWPAAWPGSGATRPLSAGGGRGVGLMAAHRPTGVALLRQAVRGDAGAHPVRLWDVDAGETVVPGRLAADESLSVALPDVAARVGALRAWLAETGADTFGEGPEVVASGAPALSSWLTDEGGGVALRYGMNRWGDAPAAASMNLSMSAASMSPSLDLTRVCWRVFGFPTVAAGCAMRIRFACRLRGFVSSPYDAEASGWGAWRVRAGVHALGVAPEGVWPGEATRTLLAGKTFEVPLLPRSAYTGGGWNWAVTEPEDTVAEGELAFAVPESRVALFAMDCVGGAETLCGALGNLPFGEGSLIVSLMAVRPHETAWARVGVAQG